MQHRLECDCCGEEEYPSSCSALPHGWSRGGLQTTDGPTCHREHRCPACTEAIGDVVAECVARLRKLHGVAK